MIAVEASPGHWVRGLATAVTGGSGNGGANDLHFSLHNADGFLHDDCDEKKNGMDATASAGQQRRQRHQRRASIGGVFQRSASPPAQSGGLLLLDGAAGGVRKGAAAPRRGRRRASIDMPPSSYDPHVYASAYRESSDSGDASEDERSTSKSLQRNGSVSGFKHFEHILALEQQEQEEQGQEAPPHREVMSAPAAQQKENVSSSAPKAERRRSIAVNIRENFLRGFDAARVGEQETQQSAADPAPRNANSVASDRQDAPPRRQAVRRVSNEDVRDVILNDDVAWHTLRLEIRKARLVTSLGVPQLCRSYVSSESGEAARQRVLRRRSMEDWEESSCETGGGRKQQVGAGVGGVMRRRLSLF